MESFWEVVGIILNVLIFLLQWIGKLLLIAFWGIGMIVCAEALATLCITLVFGFIFSGYRHWVVDSAVPGLARAVAFCYRKVFNIEEEAPQFLKKDGTPDMRYTVNRKR